MVRSARTRQRRSFRNPARHRRARHAASTPPAGDTLALCVADPDEWGAAAVELGLVTRIPPDDTAAPSRAGPAA